MRTSVALLLLVVSLSARPQTPTQPDPYVGSQQGRVYSNEFFGFTFEIPEGMSSQLEFVESLAENPAQDPSVIAQQKAYYRGQDILLFARRKTIYKEPDGRVRIAFPGDIKIIAVPIPPAAKGYTAAQAAQDELDRIKKAQSATTKAAPSRVEIRGAAFVRVDATVPTQRGASVWTDFVTIRDGYVLEFIFTATSEDDLAVILSSMQNLHFHGDGGT